MGVRKTLTPRRVRQFIQQAKDGGKTWSVWFDGAYVRRMD